MSSMEQLTRFRERLRPWILFAGIHLYLNENDKNLNSWFSMSAIPGCRLMDAWPSMNEAARRATQTDLRNYLHELRAVPPPTPTYIGPVARCPRKELVNYYRRQLIL
ncbi:hypothetical protein B0O99DRAFT_623226 [Bisporella sp. PMI_857]|nr:hypothetical protein B0O99DRAFT_623226 [Bisporella sp. PMI_857]